jgi:hypothetical protein
MENQAAESARYTRQLKKFMERCFNMIDHETPATQTTVHHSDSGYDYVQENCRHWRMHD